MTSVTLDQTRVDRPARQHGLDLLRAGALVLGIVLHSLLPFVTGVPWLVTDSSTSPWLGIPVFVIHLFRMALFMLLAGYFGRLVLQRRGPGRYLKDRVVRILLPLIVFWPVAVLSLGLIAVWNGERNDIPLVPPPPPEGPQGPWSINPGQLWFLWVLMQCVVIVLALRGLGLLLLGPDRAARLVATLGGVLTRPGAVLLAAVPYALGLVAQGSVLGSIIAPPTLLPELPALSAYLGAFVVGWLLHAHPDALGRLGRQWPLHLVAAVSLTVFALVLSDPAAAVPLVAAAAVTGLAAWCWVYALIGLCVRFVRGESPAVRYVADASYWMYLIHLPLLLALEVLLVPLAWPIALKLALTWVVVGTLLIASYHLLVRSTPIGRWLNGRRYPFRNPFRYGRRDRSPSA